MSGDGAIVFGRSFYGQFEMPRSDVHGARSPNPVCCGESRLLRNAGISGESKEENL